MLLTLLILNNDKKLPLVPKLQCICDENFAETILIEHGFKTESMQYIRMKRKYESINLESKPILNKGDLKIEYTVFITVIG